MPVLRQHHTRDFTVIPNALLQDRRLSFRDIGLLAWMLSKPQDWRFTYEGMLADHATDGKSAMQAGVKCLKKAGYLRIEKRRNKGRLAESIWYVYDSPHIEKPYMENPPQLNKESTKNRAAEKAVPGLEAGGQPLGNCYYDQEAGEWRRKA